VRMGHVSYSHDTKSNPLFVHKDLLSLLLQNISKNNIVQEDHYDSDLQMEDKYVYTYVYKANGFPQRAEIKKGLPGQIPVTNQAEFIYK